MWFISGAAFLIPFPRRQRQRFVSLVRQFAVISSHRSALTQLNAKAKSAFADTLRADQWRSRGGFGQDPEEVPLVQCWSRSLSYPSAVRTSRPSWQCSSSSESRGDSTTRCTSECWRVVFREWPMSTARSLMTVEKKQILHVLLKTFPRKLGALPFLAADYKIFQISRFEKLFSRKEAFGFLCGLCYFTKNAEIVTTKINKSLC